MKKGLAFVVLCLVLAAGFLNMGAAEFPYKDPKVPVEERIADLLKRMTLEEKIDELCGKDFMDGKTNERLGIPPLLMTDGPHGVRENMGSFTCFPTLVMLGSTWDEELMNKMGIAIGEETRARGRNLILGPCINIHRHPIGGRNFESFGEDPYLISKMVVAYVKGVQSRKIGTSTKHFAANNQEWERNTISVEIDERALREIYLPGFKAAVKEAKTTTVMGAYNKINGHWCCENSHLLIDILKNEWGFKGIALSDWWAIHNNLKAANEGLDMEMPGPGYAFTREVLLPAVREGKVKMSDIDDKVKRILRIKYELGLFDGVEKKYKGAANTKEHQNLARKIAENGIILLKNENNVLPLKSSGIKTIAVIGPNAAQARNGGGGSSTVNPPYAISPLEGLEKKCGDKIKINYANGCLMAGDIDPIPSSVLRPSAPSKEKGLSAVYYNNESFSGTPVLERVDKTINFDWGDNAPDSSLGKDNFSVRWSGKLIAPKSGRYKLSLMSDDGSRLYIDNKQVIDNWGDHAVQVKEAEIQLVKGRAYDIRAEFYEKGGGAVMKLGWVTPTAELLNEAVKTARESDVAIVFAGLNSIIEGEGYDRKDMKLPAGQDRLIEAVSTANKNTIVVLINGTNVNMEKWVNKVPAIIEAWYPGMEGGNAIANILFGDVNPSGKLSITLPKKLSDNPAYANYPGSGGKVFYKEGIFVGYRHYDRYNIEPQFPFGHGLSYTQFEYSNLQIEPKTGASSYPVKVSVDVKNTGKREGKEVVQLYVYDVKSSVPRPKKELKAFEKINLKPGQSKTVKFELNEDALAFYSNSKRKWVVESGEFKILVGSSSRDIRLEDSFSFTSR